MSNYLFPTFQGWSIEKVKKPIWKTDIFESTSGLETRIQKWSYPRYEITLNYNFLTDNSIDSVSLLKGELETLQGFFNSVGGTSQDFLYLDDVEHLCENQAFGIGDGEKTEFQLIRSLPNWTEPIRGILDTPTIKINGVETSDFTFDNYGKITFDTAVANNAVLTWSGAYYFRVRFKNDELELSRTWDGLYEGIEIELITVK